mgnify:CR=1 FL=1
MDYEKFNRDWLAAWSAKDVDGVASFYTDDAAYLDQQVPNGVSGQAQLKEYLAGLFAMVPDWHYEPEEVWSLEGGYCGRWICTMKTPEGEVKLRGFDLCLIKDGKIAHNEVYTHQL